MVTKARGVYLKGIIIRGKTDDKSIGVSSLVKPRDTQEIRYNTNVFKYGNEDINQDVPDNLYDMLVTEFPTQKKDGQVALNNSEVNDVVNKVSKNIDDVVDDIFIVNKFS